MLRKRVQIGSKLVAACLVGMLALTACGGGGSGAEGANAMAGLETDSVVDPNANLTIGDDMTVPANWPAVVPVFTTGSLSTVAVNDDGSADASWTTSATAEAVATEYEAALKAAGYTVVSGSELTGVEDMSGADYSGNGYAVNVLVSTTDGETTLFVTAAKA